MAMRMTQTLPCALVADTVEERHGGLLLFLVNPASIVLFFKSLENFGALYSLCALPLLVLYATRGNRGRCLAVLLNPRTIKLFTILAESVTGVILADGVAGSIARLIVIGPILR